MTTVLVKIKKCNSCAYLYSGYRRCPGCGTKEFSYEQVDYKTEKWKPRITIPENQK